MSAQPRGQEALCVSSRLVNLLLSTCCWPRHHLRIRSTQHSLLPVKALKDGIPDIDVSKYKNPGDFIIDAIGLDPESDKTQERDGNEVEQETSHL